MIPVYAKLGIVVGGLLGAAFGVKKLMNHPALAPNAPPAPAPKPAPSSVSQAFADPQSTLLPSGQTQAEVDAIAAQNSAELAQMLDAELASL